MFVGEGSGSGKAFFIGCCIEADMFVCVYRRQERLELGEAVALIEAVKNIFREESNMVELEAPVSFCFIFRLLEFSFLGLFRETYQVHIRSYDHVVDSKSVARLKI